MFYLLLLFVCFVFLYYKNRNLFFIGTLLFLVAGRFIFFKSGNLFAPTVNNVVFLAVCMLFFTDKTVKKYFKFVLGFIVVYIGYFLFLSVIGRINFVVNVIYYKTTLIGLLYGLLLFENIKNGKVNVSWLIKSLYILVIGEVLLAWVQFFDKNICDYFRVTQYMWKGQLLSVTGDFDDAIDNNLMLGTMMAGSLFANFLSFSIIALMLYKFSSPRNLTWTDKILFLFFMVTLFMTGIRAAFAGCILGWLFLLYKFRKKGFYFSMIGFAFLVIIFGITFFANVGADNLTDSRSDSIQRILGALVLFTGDMDLIKNTTAGLTIMMIPYILKNPLFGVGLHDSKGYYLFDRGRFLEDLSTSDAQLFFVIAEIGLVGLVLYFYPFRYFIKQTLSTFPAADKLKYLLGIGVIMTIVDSGMWDNYFVFLFFYCIVIAASQKEIRTASK